MKKILFIFLFILIVTNSWGATIYLRTDGTAGSGDKANASSCSAASTAWNEASHNTCTGCSAGDDFVLCNDGGDINAQLTIPISGVDADNLTAYSCNSGTCTIDLGGTGNYCFRGIDKEFIFISGISTTNPLTCTNTAQSGIRFSNTDGSAIGDTITIDKFKCDDVKQNCVWIEGFDATDKFSNITISSSVFNRWSQESTAGDGDNKLGAFASAAIAIKFTDTISITKNDISHITCDPDDGRGVGDSCGNGIVLIGTEGAIIEYNKITTMDTIDGDRGGHGIYIACTNSTTGCDGSGIRVRYNYIYDAGDDFIWVDNQENNPQFYGNLLVGTDDDCTDFRGGAGGIIIGTGKVYNNTCINWVSYGIQTIQRTAVEYKNNVYIGNVDTCNPDNDPCFAVFEDTQDTGRAVMATSTFNNNIYYNSSSNGDVEAFLASDLDTGTTVIQDDPNGATSKRGTFVQWQADDSAPDSNSSISNPNVDDLGNCIAGTSMPIKGTDLSGTFTQLLAQGATWAVGVAPALVTVSIFPVGAIANYDLCATGFAVGGVTLTGGITIQ